MARCHTVIRIADEGRQAEIQVGLGGFGLRAFHAGKARAARSGLDGRLNSDGFNG